MQESEDRVSRVYTCVLRMQLRLCVILGWRRLPSSVRPAHAVGAWLQVSASVEENVHRLCASRAVAMDLSGTAPRRLEAPLSVRCVKARLPSDALGPCGSHTELLQQADGLAISTPMQALQFFALVTCCL